MSMNTSNHKKTANGWVPITGTEGGGFTPSDYTTAPIILSAAGTGEALTLATGTAKIQIVNNSATGVGMLVAFGTNDTDAIANLATDLNKGTTGYIFPPLVDSAAGSQVYGVPSGAGSVAFINDTNGETPTVVFTQGV